MARRRAGGAVLILAVPVAAVALVGGIGRISGLIAVAAGRRLAGRARAVGAALGCVAVVAGIAVTGFRQAVVCLLHAFVYTYAQKCARMDESTINKGFKLLSPRPWPAMRTPVRVPISSLVLNIVLNPKSGLLQ